MTLYALTQTLQEMGAPCDFRCQEKFSIWARIAFNLFCNFHGCVCTKEDWNCLLNSLEAFATDGLYLFCPALLDLKNHRQKTSLVGRFGWSHWWNLPSCANCEMACQ